MTHDFEIEQIRPKYCPINSDNCVDCQYLEYVTGLGLYGSCKYEKEE